ncbi:MAG: IS1634 family transposase [Rubrobacter sp.]
MDESNKAPRIEVRDVDHLGIVAGIIDEAGLVDEVDRRVGTHPQEHVSCGRAVKAMILNALGFLSAPLYLFEEFFAGKATEHLIGPGIKPEHLNDDRLGRVLDKLFDAGLTELFVNVAAGAAERFDLPEPTSLHLDATSFHLHGRYDTDGDGREPEEIRITRGYSRDDRRPELKQFVVDLMSTGRGGVPLFFRVADGNEADQAVFAELIEGFRARLDLDALFVADAALYGAENLASLGGLRWLCRVPKTLAEAKRALAQTPQEAFVESELHQGYRIARTSSDYGGVEQRWLVVESEELEQAARRRLQRSLARRERELDAELERRLLARRVSFACRRDAEEAVEAFAAECLRGDKHHRLAASSPVEIVEEARYEKPGRPSKGAEPEEVRYRIAKAGVERDEAAIEEEIKRSGRYVLATNVLPEEEGEEELTDERLLAEYKGRHAVERGFRFLKDPLFFASSVFLKSPKRVAAVAMVMGLCLLVYALGERSLREALAEAGAAIRHQRGKPTRKPTLRWVFQLFQAVHLLKVDGAQRISNLTEERTEILSFLGRGCRRYYLLS